MQIDAELRDEEAELVDAPAPAAAREQIKPSAASRDRVASWAAARRSIVFGLQKKTEAATTTTTLSMSVSGIPSRGKEVCYAGETERQSGKGAMR